MNKDIKFAVLGLGESGFWAARLLVSRGYTVCAGDDNATASVAERAGQLESEGLGAVRVGRDTAGFFADRQCGCLVLSPGISRTHPAVSWAYDKGIPVVSEIEIASVFARAPVIALTGTNGKTTTVRLMGDICTAAGISSKVCGNVGTAFSRAVLEESPQVFIVEVSSFQLQTCPAFMPAAAVFLNFSDDHMDFHASMDEYFEAKMRLFKGLDPDCCIIDEGDVYTGFNDRFFYAYRSYSLDDSETAFLMYRGNGLWLRQKQGTLAEQFVLLRDITWLNPLHNRRNLCAAVTGLMAGGIPLHPEAVTRAVQGFSTPAHRLQFIGIHNGAAYYNDSKSTNPDSLIRAVESVSKPVILIAGGKDKGSDFTPVLPVLKRSVRLVIAMGEIRHQLKEAFSSVLPVYIADSMDAAVCKAVSAARHGDTVLFSPGCSSFDMFTDYAQRGRAFVSAVNHCFAGNAQGTEDWPVDQSLAIAGDI